VSMQQMVALVPSESERETVRTTALRRFGGMVPVIGTTSELTNHFRALVDRGVERFYVWLADFAPVTTLERFADVIADFAR